MWSVTFSRTSLSLPDLVIGGDPNASNFHLPEDGADRPNMLMRRTYAPDSAYVGGRQMLAAVRDAGSIPLVIYVHATTAALLETAKDELEAATSQWTYDLTLTVNGQARTWAADPELPTWGALDSGMVKAHLARASIVIPLNPA